jgi:uncharacterized protein
VNFASALAAKESKPMKPNQIEDLDVREHETSFRSQQLRQKQPEATQTEKCFLKRLHWMRCPKCGMELACERHGTVEIDVCVTCRGVWLDARQLEAILAAENGPVRSRLRSLCGH